MRKGLAYSIRALAGLVVGLALSEIAFRVRDHGAFPHLNVFEPDPVLGVRLRPRSTMRLSFGGNPVTTVRVNSDGLRGAELPPPSDDEVLVVGDSQVFGLGVEEGETASARLEPLLHGAKVVNAGVPTYGPPEYEKVVEAMLARRKPKRVVYVVNMGNDLFEATRPNVDRHAVWDGWAVRKETAPVHVVSFPGRDLLFERSHAVFALRRFWYRLNEPKEDLDNASSGGWQDIADAALRATDEHGKAKVETRRLADLALARVGLALSAQRQARDAYLKLADDQGLNSSGFATLFSQRTEVNLLAASFAEPGDIVGEENLGEFSRPVYATAEIILNGVKARKAIEAMLRNRAASSPQAAAKIEPVLARTAEAEARIVKVEGEAPPVIEAWSPLAPSIRRVQALCDAAGARLFVAVLPMDVQISDEEWKKYGAKRLDLAPARVLVDDVLASADAVGATPIDLTQALRAAEPGAFVDRDPHLSPKGQAAVATALAAGLEQKPVPKLPAPPRGMPIGRKPPTSLHDARSRHEVTVPGSTAAGCETYIVDEWLTLRCHDQGADKAAPLGVHVVTSPLSESTVYRDSKAPERAVVIQVPVLKGEPTVVDIRWPSRSRRLDATWKDGVVTVAFHPLPADAPAVADLAPPREAICACQKEVSGRPGCGDGPVSDNPACFRSYAGDCASILRCLGGDHGTPPECPRGTGPVGVFQRCSPLCSVEVACTEGKCTPYGGAQVCL